MPELPEVETMVRGIRPHVEGGRIIDLSACPCTCRPISIRPELSMVRSAVCGQKITQIRRRAKRVVLVLESGSAIVIEPRMTGLMLISDPPDPEHLRICWTIQTSNVKRSLWFWDRRGLGTVRLLNPNELTQLDGHEYLGPDALLAEPEHWVEISRGTRRSVKVVLLDQSKIAGIGNLYASEILHLSRVHPETPADRLTLDQLRVIAENTRKILLTAIEHEGSTLSDGTYRNALNQSGGYQNAHRVYDREGETCLTCQAGTIVRIVQSQRSTFFCPSCQRAGRGRKRRVYAF